MELISQLDFILQYDWVRYTMVAMVIMRIIFKPLFAILAKYVELTVKEEDNEKLNKIMSSKWYKLTAFAVDLFASVKMPKLKDK